QTDHGELFAGMQREVDICQSVLIGARVAEGNIFKPDFVLPVCAGCDVFTIFKFERLVIFKTLTNRRNVKRLLVQCIESSEDTGYPFGKTAHCRKKQKES